MKKLALGLGVASLGFFACNKDNDTGKPTGTIRYTNTSGDTYDIYLDNGAYGQVPPNTSQVLPNVPADSHSVKAIQANNYTQKPIIKENKILVTQGQETVFAFP